ncbi:MAG: hypothetical protein KIT34_15595 [Cyanobacteria bacterium TGS_CYA1]|nr:hypothetical protein [Cyanobacteria bacterium TGS_CYA1]
MKPTTGYSLYGVARDIPEAIKRDVRRECGCGCVIDGKMIVAYDHFDPQFHLLKYQHESAGIALLCPDCHHRKNGSSPQLTDAQVKKHKERPYALRKGKATYPQFFLPPGPERFRIGEVVLKGNELILQTKNQVWLRIKQPTEDFEPVLVDTFLNLEHGNPLLHLSDNVLTAFPSEHFDFVEKASSLKAYFDRKVILHLDRSDSRVMDVKYAETWIDGNYLQVQDSGIYINGHLIFGGGDFQIHATGTITLNLDLMLQSKLLGETFPGLDLIW